MIDMSLSKAEAKEESGAIGEYNLPKYPYGLCIYLDDESMAKLGMSDLPKVGETLMLKAQVVVTSTRASQTQAQKDEGGETSEKSVDLQITGMELDGGVSDDARAAKLYSGSKT